jgi:hypothetical protein
MRLLKTPARPRWSATTKTISGKVAHREWLPFVGLVDASYWNTELLDDNE